MSADMVVVFDANVVIPMIVPASRSTRLFLRLQAANYKVTVSWQILAEVEEKLRTKRELRKWLGVTDDRIERFIQRLPTVCLVVSGLRNVHGAVKADPDDDKIIAAAVESGAAYIVSEDKHLLDLGEYEGIKIMNRVDFSAELDRLGIPS